MKGRILAEEPGYRVARSRPEQPGSRASREPGAEQTGAAGFSRFARARLC
jgi:hypothetical protein